MNVDERKQAILAKKDYKFDDLVEILRLLRGEGGCPWDREQTHQSIRKDLIEETYELVEGIDEDDPAMMREELGDVLLQVVFHSGISEDAGDFDIDDVCDDVCKKLIVRHPHVFGDVVAETSGEVLKNWDNIKKETKHQTTDTDVLRSISKALPALMRAQKLGQKSRKWGFDFEDARAAAEKIPEETAEAMAAFERGDADAAEEEFGDLLLAVVNAARLAGVDAEKALYRANEKYITRFEEVERLCRAEGKSVSETPFERKCELWDKAKEILAEKAR
ncbi:MAG: nucleoside triphosphate pyrophosphohydrolase [Clostridia bacterium]|nr:nucleoside triphosphate pyrophosphohydrolase [Clostridia bacterium]